LEETTIVITAITGSIYVSEFLLETKK